MPHYFYKFLIAFIILVSGIGWLPPALANDLTTVTVPVTSQSAADLHFALMNAFPLVLVKISGNPNITDNPALKAALPTVEKFVQQYSYDNAGLEVVFNLREINAFLALLGQPVWSVSRPHTLIWVNAPSEELTNSVFTSANQRGIVLTFLQAADKQKLLQDPSGLAPNYQCEAVLMGDVSQDANQKWTGKWSFIWQGQTLTWEDSELTPSASAQAAVNKIADLMAKELAINPDLQAVHKTWLAVLGVTTLEDYQQVLQELYKISAINAISTQEVGSSGILLRITTAAQSDQLKSALDKTSHFTATPSQTATPDVLNYHWAR